MLGFIIKIVTVSILALAPLVALALYGKHCLSKTKRKIETFTQDRRGDMRYMDSLPGDYMPPQLVVRENVKVLKLNSRIKHPDQSYMT